MRRTKASQRVTELRRDRQALWTALAVAGAHIASQESIQCPFCKDSYRSGRIYPTKCGAWRYRCKSCGFRGDLFDVLARHQGRPLEQLLKECAEKGRGDR